MRALRPGFCLFVLGLAALAGCSPAPNPWAGQPGPPRVVVTFPPLECFVKNVAGDRAGVLSLATGNGPHHYEPTITEALKLRQADFFFTIGLDLDDRFVDRLANASVNSRLTKGKNGLVKLGDRMLKSKDLVLPSASARLDHDTHDSHAGHDHGDGCDCQHGEWDPHVWTGIPQAIRMVEVIRDELKAFDPEDADGYDARAAAYVARLQALHQEGRKLLQDKKDRNLVTFHDSLRYFARSFDLDIAGVLQPRPGTDADPATLAELVRLSKDKGVRVLASEPQYKQKGAIETLLQELRRKGVPDAVLVEIDPLETATDGDPVDTGWYERKMRHNLQTLAGALQ